MIKSIIFDYDGVIVDSFGSIFEVYQEIAKDFKVDCPKDYEAFRRVYGHDCVECLDNLGIGLDNFDRANEIYRREIIKKKHRQFSGIGEVIKKLSQGYKLFLVSAASHEEVLGRLKEFGLADFFSGIFCVFDEGIPGKKSKSELIKELIEDNHFKNEEVISIGDRTVDYEAAKKAGLEDDNIIIAKYGWGYDEKIVKTKNIANKPEDILALVEKIAAKS